MGFSTWDVYQLLSKEGYISRIQVHRNGSAFVVFCPPPNQAFWEFPLRLRNHAERLRVEYVPPNRSYQIPSPVNPDKLYCERTILSASELEFGFMYDADSMMAMSKISMANIARKNDRGIQITLNLERKEIDVQATIGLKRAEPDKGLWNYRYRFRLPISQLQRVYEVRVPGDRKCELVIPFETPPAFFRQTEDIAGTHKDGRFWNEWQTWSRQTNVLHFSHSKTIETTAVDLRNRHAVVDIGMSNPNQVSRNPLT
jgi:RNA-dependent RNA polymerase